MHTIQQASVLLELWYKNHHGHEYMTYVHEREKVEDAFKSLLRQGLAATLVDPRNGQCVGRVDVKSGWWWINAAPFNDAS